MRRATVRTDHGEARIARAIAAALTPDNTAEMATRVDGTTVETTIERETTGGLHATVDDYVVNVTVAARLTDRPDAPAGGSTDRNGDADTDRLTARDRTANTETDSNANTDTDTNTDT